MEIYCGEYKAMREDSFLSSWLRKYVEERQAEMERRNEEAKQQESKRGKREVEGEGERVKIKRTCVNRMLCNCFEDFSSMAEWESDGDSLGFSVCVTAASSSVTVVPVALVSPSSVSGFGETVLSDSDCQFVESQTLHSPKSVTRLQHPGKRFAGSKTEVNIGGRHETERLSKK